MFPSIGVSKQGVREVYRVMRRGAEPDLYTYLSYRAWLADWYAARKEADARFSHRLFARRAGVSSPSLLNEVIAGRRNLTPRTTEGFVDALGLDVDGAAFFTALVLLDQAVSDEEKNTAWEQVASSRRFRTARPVDSASVRYLSTWYYPAIREFALCEGFEADPEWIRKRMMPPITAGQAKEALDTLFELGFLVRDGDRVRAADVSVATPHEVAGLAVHNYHAQMLLRAKDAIDGAPPSDRHLLGVTVAIPHALVGQLKRELDAIQERLLHLCDDALSRRRDGDPSGEPADRVYQIELCLVPLTRGEDR